MASQIDRVRALLQIPLRRLPYPRLLFTVDSSQPEFEELRPILELFADHRIPVTFFVCNETLSGKENHSAVQEMFAFSRDNELCLEIASHGIRHRDLAKEEPEDIIEMIEQSVRDFNGKELRIQGFRAPFLSIENRYRHILASKRWRDGLLRFDSSICFESSLVTSLFHILARRKCPHKIGSVWELPISALDDYHVMSKQGRSEQFAFLYWIAEMNAWIRLINYFMLTLHPHTIGKNLLLLDRVLRYCRNRFPEDSFRTCTQLVEELDARP
jgi:peptidoglycan/xylan/chitin deacetylase (PgdA/CDA1 family)